MWCVQRRACPRPLHLNLFPTSPTPLINYVLVDTNRANEPLEIVCVIGRRLRDWDDSPTGEERSRESLKALNARVVSYDELIDNALQAYQDYLDRGQEAGRVYRLIQEISEQDVQAISLALD